MPPELHNRAADNWRPLLAIADDLGHGEDARTAAIALSVNRLDEDPGVILLTDIRSVFDASGVDRLTSAALVEALLALEDSLWHDWRGLRDDRPARKLSQSELARLLRPFSIRPHVIWPANRMPGDKSFRGYLRSKFELAWAAIVSRLSHRHRLAMSYTYRSRQTSHEPSQEPTHARARTEGDFESNESTLNSTGRAGKGGKGRLQRAH